MKQIGVFFVYEFYGNMIIRVCPKPLGKNVFF